MKNILLLLLSIPLFSYSQTGPGGVGKSDGTSSLVLWLDANAVVGANASIVTTWEDQSGYGSDFTVGNGALFNTSYVNGYPSFNFNGTNQYFERVYTANLNPSSFTIFSTTNVTSSGLYKAVISNRDDPAGSATAGYILYSKPTTNKWSFWTGTSSSWAQSNSASSTAGSWAGQVLEYQNTASGKRLYVNGATDVVSTQGMDLNPNRPCRIGAGRNESTPNYYFKGDISEVIIFNKVLNKAERIIVNNYLSAKYDYSLSTDDLYTEDNAGNGNYDHDVAGIGRVDVLNIHDDSQGTGIVRVLNPTNLDDDEFLIWGHDTGLQQAIEKADVPPALQARFDRVWRVSEVNSSSSGVDVGGVDIRFDLTGIGSVVASDLRLLVDVDNDGVFVDEVPISGATSLGGGIYQFAGITTISNNLRFTLGTINLNQTPLPIELLSFNAEIINTKSVKINWKTASEINNSYFTIERSKNGIDWLKVSRVEGAGNSSSLIDYVVFDDDPLEGRSYYRLKQTDFDGEFSFSNIETIDMLTLRTSKVEVRPNPTTGVVSVVGDESELGVINVYNVFGENVTNQLAISSWSEGGLVVDLSILCSGIYFIRSKTMIKKVYKQ